MIDIKNIKLEFDDELYEAEIFDKDDMNIVKK